MDEHAPEDVLLVKERTPSRAERNQDDNATRCRSVSVPGGGLCAVGFGLNWSWVCGGGDRSDCYWRSDNVKVRARAYL